MKKSYSTPNVVFQPLSAENNVSGGTCAFVKDQPNANFICPVRPAEGTTNNGIPEGLNVFIQNTCMVEADKGDFCYTTGAQAIFAS